MSGGQGLAGRRAVVHPAEALGSVLQWDGEVEGLAGVDLAVPNELDQLGQEAAHAVRATVQVDLVEEQLAGLYELNCRPLPS